MDLSQSLNLTPEKVIQHFEAKGYTISWDWHDTWQEAHTKAFTVAKCTKMDVLEDIRKAVHKSIETGQTFRDFQKELMPTLKTKGWWGMQKQINPNTGKEEEVQLGSPYRLKTIYQTNLQTSFMTGRYKEMMTTKKTRPYWQYIAVMDNRTRLQHKLLNEKVFPVDDTFWNTHYPPNGWRCRCRVRSLSDFDLQRYGLTPESSEGNLVDMEVPVSKNSDKTTTVTGLKVKDPATGTTTEVFTQPGWNYNPGKAAYQPDLDKYDYKIAKQYVEEVVQSPAFEKFLEGQTLGNIPVAVLNPELKELIGSKTQAVLLSSQTLTKNINNHKDLNVSDYKLIPEIISTPDLIIKKSDEILIFIKKQDKYYFASVKKTKNSTELYCTSMHITSEVYIQSQMRKGEVIKNTLENTQ